VRLFSKNRFPHIKFGFRGEGIIYHFGEKQIELDSTWIEGRRIFFDHIHGAELTDSEKHQLFRDVIAFVNQTEKRKPIIGYNTDVADAEIWRTF
jgi:hypothetical protein